MRRDLLLNAEGIDEVAEAGMEFLMSAGVRRRDALAARISIESALMLLRDELGEGAPMRLVLKKLFGRRRLAVMVRGRKVDPAELADLLNEVDNGMSQAAFEASGLKPTFSYRGGYNIAMITSPHPPLSSLTRIIIAAVAGFVVAGGSSLLLPHEATTWALEAIVKPLFNLYLAMLSGIAGPLIFLSVASSVCGIGDVATLGRSGGRLAKRFLGENLLATLVAAACIPIFRLPEAASEGGSDLVGSIIQMIIGLVPTNFVNPFAEGNTSQIIILGLAIGIAILILGNRCAGIRLAIEELDGIIQFLMDQLCRFLPVFIFLMVLVQGWSGAVGQLLSAWLPALLAVGLILVLFGASLAFVSIRNHLPVGALFGAIRPALIIGLTTASSGAAFATMVETLEEKMGVDHSQSSFAVSLGVVLCKQSVASMLTVLIVYCAHVYGVGVDLIWYVRLALVCFLYSMVTPPVPGGRLVAYSLLFAELGIPTEALVLVTALDVILDYVSTGMRVGLIMLDTFDISQKIGAAGEHHMLDA